MVIFAKTESMPQKAHIRQMFDGIAAHYDRLNHLMSLSIDRTWRRRALRALVQGAVAPREVLDLACGTGDFSIAIARALPQAQVTGLDLSAGMLEVMAGKVEKEGLGDRIRTLQGDGEALPFGDGSFDRVGIAFGIRNFEDREQGLREMLRVLRPGGRLVVLELSVPEQPLLRRAYDLYFLHILPWIGGRISGDRAAYRYLPASVKKFPGKDAFMGTLHTCGFCNVRHKALSLGICRIYAAEKPLQQM